MARKDHKCSVFVAEAYRSLDKKYPSLPVDQQEDYMKDFLRLFSEETGIDFVDENTLDKQISFNFPTVVLLTRK